MNRLAFFLILAIVSSFFFSGIVHALIPHSHGGNEVLAQSMHVALRVEQKLAVVASSFLIIVAAIRILATTRFEPVVAVSGTLERQLHRGIFKYRRFR